MQTFWVILLDLTWKTIIYTIIQLTATKPEILKQFINQKENLCNYNKKIK